MAEIKYQQHGRELYYIVGEGFKPVLPSANLFAKGDLQTRVNLIAQADDIPLTEDRLQFKFGRMFGNDNGLIALGEAMLQKFDTDPKTDISKTPAGYTFLGQFIDHDMTFDVRKEIDPGTINAETLLSKRSPSLDLDSLYGQLFFLNGTVRFDERLREDKIYMKVGKTDIVKVRQTDVLLVSHENDLPREADSRTANVGDPRNDENLGIAQTHVAFLRFHNAVVDYLLRQSPEITKPEAIFRTARKTVIKHYQWIILHDFLPRILDEQILNNVIATAENGDGPDWLRPEAMPFMPVEFAGAAYRLGHSMLRDAYEWNRFFETPDPPDPPATPDFLKRRIATFEFLFQFTGRGGLGNAKQIILPGDWIIDWRRFYDFTRHGIDLHPKFNYSRKIDTFIAESLGTIPEFNQAIPTELRKLPVRNLLRGRLLGIPTGQQIGAVLVRQEKLRSEQLLSTKELITGEHEKILKYYGFDEETPLWYYILKEAEVKGNGNHLGPVGSYIIAETFVKLIQQSEISILRNRWTPTLPAPRYSPKGFEMADLIKFADQSTNTLINPLGDND